MRRRLALKLPRSCALGAAVAALLWFAAPTQHSAEGFFPLPIVPPGACVLADGSCQVMPDTFCRLLGGSFQGAGTTCP